MHDMRFACRQVLLLYFSLVVLHFCGSEKLTKKAQQLIRSRNSRGEESSKTRKTWPMQSNSENLCETEICELLNRASISAAVLDTVFLDHMQMFYRKFESTHFTRCAKRLIGTLWSFDRHSWNVITCKCQFRYFSLLF